MTDDELFDELDLDGDGLLTRDEIQRAARLFGWHWRQAPFYALLDFMTIRVPLDRQTFLSCMEMIAADPSGVYGRVMHLGLHRHEVPVPGNAITGHGPGPGVKALPIRNGTGIKGFVQLLKQVKGEETGNRFADALKRLDLQPIAVRRDKAALLIIDPQRSFTSGDWMRSMGPAGEIEAMPIRLAFDNCACLLDDLYRRVDVMFTRCPFPPDSYGWDERLEGIIDAVQPYFIKPGNNVLAPPTNGFRQWVDGLLTDGRKTLVMGGCTLNSCVRVSSIAIRELFAKDGCDVVVDLSLCGARAGNYERSDLFSGMSSVESAIRQMSESGVTVAERVEWSCP